MFSGPQFEPNTKKSKESLSLVNRAMCKRTTAVQKQFSAALNVTVHSFHDFTNFSCTALCLVLHKVK